MNTKEDIIRIIDALADIEKGHTFIDFTAGDRGEDEAGIYCFWTISGSDNYGLWTFTIRVKDGLPVSDRIARISKERLKESGGPFSDIRAYEPIWQWLTYGNIESVKPASYRAVSRWLSGHESDAVYVVPDWQCEGRACSDLPPLRTV